MTVAPDEPRVPARLVLLSLAALWTCYFFVATLRGAFLGIDFGWDVISRRLTICVLSFLVMAAVWPLLQILERRGTVLRFVIVLVGALPLAMGLSMINDVVFADIDARLEKHDRDENADKGVRIIKDEAGNLLVDVPGLDSIPVPPSPLAPVPPVPPRAREGTNDGETPSVPDTPNGSVTIRKSASGAVTIETAKEATHEKTTAEKWAQIADAAFSRYFLVLAWAALYFALAKAEEARVAEHREGEFRRAAAAAEIRSLRYQVNPHFLFNTLNSLSALVLTERYDDAERMIQMLSNFYRRTLTGDPTSDLTLADEVELQKLYLTIEGVRFPERLRTRIDIDPALGSAMIPGMILQPLIENSVKYAVAATQKPVTIAIQARHAGHGGEELLELTVSDDGPGKPEDGDKPGFGIGLGNVRDRLIARFGDRAQVFFGPRPDGGFATVLRFPLER